jgi:hypothetical protein
MLCSRFSSIALLAALAATATSGCFTTLVRTDTLTAEELYAAPVGPPQLPEDAIVSAPSPAPAGATWEEPYWLWYGGMYTWMPGRWIPTMSGYAFHQPHWVSRDGHWLFSGGVWTDASGQIVASAPPQTAVGPAQGTTVGGFVEAPVVATAPPSAPTSTTIITGDATPEVEHHGRLDHTVTLGHLYYGSPRRSHDEPAPSPAPRPDSHYDHGMPYAYGTVVTGRMPIYRAARTYTAPAVAAPPLVAPSCPIRSAPPPSYGAVAPGPVMGGSIPHETHHGGAVAPR